MKTIVSMFSLILCVAHCAAQRNAEHRFIHQGNSLSAYINEGSELVVTSKKDGNELMRINLAEYEAAQYIEDTTYGHPYRILDVNFDGYDDISFPSNSGNVQRFEEVYLYDPAKNAMVSNAALSEVACLEVNAKTKTISGTCNHSSAAENWTETYKWFNGKLVLIEREGTLPCPPDEDCYYTYREKRVKGKMVYIYKKKNKY